MKTKLDREEKELLDSFEEGEWKRVPDLQAKRKQYQRAAAATFRKDKRVNIRISQKDLDAIRQRAAEEGIPYQTLMSSILHKYVNKTTRQKIA